MRWLVTFDADLADEDLAARLAEAGGTLPEDASRVPLGEKEATVEVEASHDAVKRLRLLPGIIGVYPSSDLTLY